MTQKALIVRTGPDGHDGLEELNIELQRGWRVVSVAPMGGAATSDGAPCHAALVVVEHREDETVPTVAVEAVEKAEREADEILKILEESSEVVEGNGADPLP